MPIGLFLVGFFYLLTVSLISFIPYQHGSFSVGEYTKKISIRGIPGIILILIFLLGI